MRVSLPKIDNDYEGYDALACFYSQTENLELDRIEVDMSETDWLSADMCAAFGAILHRLNTRLNKVNLLNIRENVMDILSRNGFLSHYGGDLIPDEWQTTISYRRFDVKDDHFFANYIEEEFIQRSELPTMTHELLKKFRESIFEIFSNAVLHSQTELGIFCCGQLFPNQNRLVFTIADLGIGICKNINLKKGWKLTPTEAINWAIQEGNTTKSSNLPGGLGLILLCDFIDLNNGCLHIVSDAGYWERRCQRIITEELSKPFPGTIVSLEIDTSDTNTYGLNSELKPDDIF
ncbi:ATP-binding protein [Candidatus Poribacteria bacterium]|nr:MAG: ATP-binding protein [Candidatus Poribacteria bacterium]